MPKDADDDFRHEDAMEKEQQLDDWLDQALEATFPASDPVASPPSTRDADESRAHQRHLPIAGD